jgi:probable rRNA maturation factor
MPIEIANESGTIVDESALSGLAGHVLDRLGVSPLAELSVLIVDSAAMAALHERWMQQPGATDVLAFPQDELAASRPEAEVDDVPPTLLGDVVLCPEVAARQAGDAGHSTADELALLCAHGILHLLGYDHAEADQEREMMSVQSRLLASWRAVNAVSGQAGSASSGSAGVDRGAGGEPPAGAGAADAG